MKMFTNEITVISYNYEIYSSENQTSVNGIKKMYRAGSLQNIDLKAINAIHC